MATLMLSRRVSSRLQATTYFGVTFRWYSSSFREERDTFGPIQVPNDNVDAFKGESMRNMPAPIVRAFGILKKCAAKVKMECGLDPSIGKAIMQAAQEVAEGKLNDHFPMIVWLTGSGTQCKMNANEVIANRAAEILGHKRVEMFVHPNDHVNRSQSSTGTFLTVYHIAAATEINSRLIPKLEQLNGTLHSKDIMKIGNHTIIRDGTPLTIGEDLFGCSTIMVEKATDLVLCTLPLMYPIVAAVSEETKLPFVTAENKFEALAHDTFVETSDSIRTIAYFLTRIQGSIKRRTSFKEVKLPEINWPSTYLLVIDEKKCIRFGVFNGHFEQDVFKPILAIELLNSFRLLADGFANFENCVRGLEVNREQIFRVCDLDMFGLYSRYVDGIQDDPEEISYVPEKMIGPSDQTNSAPHL